MALLLLLSAAQIAYAFGATGNLFAAASTSTASISHLVKHQTLLARR